VVVVGLIPLSIEFKAVVHIFALFNEFFVRIFYEFSDFFWGQIAQRIVVCELLVFCVYVKNRVVIVVEYNDKAIFFWV